MQANTHMLEGNTRCGGKTQCGRRMGGAGWGGWLLSPRLVWDHLQGKSTQDWRWDSAARGQQTVWDLAGHCEDHWLLTIHLVVQGWKQGNRFGGYCKYPGDG